MHNLAGVPTHISNSQILVELAKAGVPAYNGEVARFGEVPTTIFGILQLYSGQTVVFTRSWYYWSVHLLMPIPYNEACLLHEKWAETIRVDGFSGSMPPDKKGVFKYDVDTQEGLDTLVELIRRLFGKGSNLPAKQADFAFITQHLATGKNVIPDTLRLLSAFQNEAELHNGEVNALCMLAQYRQAPHERIAIYEQALALAKTYFGGERSDITRITAVSLVRVLQEAITRTKQLLDAGHLENNVATFLHYVYELEEYLTKRIVLLQFLRRHKEARALRSDLDNTRQRLDCLYQRNIQLAEQSINQDLANKKCPPETLDYHRYQEVLLTISYSKLLARMNRHRESKQLLDRAVNVLLPKVTCHSYRQEIDERLAKAA
jgi:hypothetical protein